MTDTNHNDTDEQHADSGRLSSTSRRGFVGGAAVGLGALAVGSTYAFGSGSPTVTASLTDEQIDEGESTTVTMGVEHIPSGSAGASIDVAVDPDVAQITAVELGEFAPPGLEDRINDDIEEAGGAVDEIDAQSFDPQGIEATSYELATITIEAASDQGTTDISLVDAAINDPEGDQIEDPEYDVPTLTVGDSDDDPQTPTVTAVPDDETLDVGETTTVAVDMDSAPDGLSGYRIHVDVNPDVVTVEDAAIGEDFEDTLFPDVTVTEDRATIEAVKEIEPGATDLELAVVELEATAGGNSIVDVSESMTLPIEDADGEPVDPEFEAATLSVDEDETEPPQPGVPDGLTISATDETSIEIDWNDDDAATSYAVYLDGTRQTETDSTGYTFDGLDPDTAYDIGVKAIAADGSETDPATIQATTDEDEADDPEPPEPTVTTALADEQIDPGQTTTVEVGLNEAPNGVSGYNITVSVDPDVATIADAEIGEDFEDTLFPDVTVTEEKATIEAVKEIEPGATELALAVVELEAAADGETVVDVDESEVLPIEDADGTPIEPEFESELLTVGDGEPEDEPPKTPEGLEIVATDEDSIELSWQPDPNAERYGVWIDGQHQTETDIAGYTAEGLEPDTTYEFEITAIGEDGTETEPASIQATTGTAPPSIPEGLDVVATDENSITVDWDEDPNAVRYAVYVDDDRISEPGTTEYTADDLAPDTTYEIAVKAIAEDGSETDPASIQATTDEEEEDDDQEYPDWDPNEVYRGGDRVHFEGQNWEAQWYNVGEEPSHEPFTAWEAIDGELPEPDGPLATIDADTTEIEVGETIAFDVIDETGDNYWITDLHWDFGDGTTAGGWWNAHEYAEAGTYTVSLTATDQQGRETTDEVTITVS